MNYSGHPYYDDFHGGGLSRKLGTLITPELPKDGNRSWQVIIQPIVEPVTVDDTDDDEVGLKTFARIDTTEEDFLLESFIVTARMATEEYIGFALISQTIQTVMDFWPRRVIELPRPPLISVDKVVALDEDNAETEYSSDNYYLNTNAIPGQMIIKRSVTSPQNTTRDYSRFLIQSVHGYGMAALDVPGPIKDGIKLWAAALYADRTINTKEPPPDARKLLDLFRIPTVMIR